jgi:glycosyltransferase involved in cell wall biosynthesis
MKRLKITIVTYSWPPRNSMSTHRPYSWARYWSKKGADVTVLTAKKKFFDYPLDMELPKLEGVKVIEVPYNVKWSRVVDAPLKYTIIKKVSKWFRKKFTEYTGYNIEPRNTWSQAANPIANKLARDQDIVISTFGPQAAHIIGCKMKILNPSIYWIADYRDLWSDNPGLENVNKVLKKKLSKEEIETIKYADLTTSVSEDICKRLHKQHKKTSIKITNGFDINKVTVKKNLSKKISKLNKIFKIVYTGAIYNDRSPIVLLDAIVNLIKKKKIPEKSIVVEFYGSRLDLIKELSQHPKYLNLIRIKNHISRTQVLEKQKKADLLLLLASSKEISRGELTGKIFEYMSAGRPILCIGARSSFEISKVLNLTNTGVNFGNHDIEKLEDLIFKSFYGGGLFKTYKPKINEVLKFSRERIANYYFAKIKEKYLNKKNALSTKPRRLKELRYKKPRVIHLITGLERGGAERFLYNLICSGLNKKFKNTVISLMSDGYYGNLLKKKNIPVHSLNMSRGKINFTAVNKLRKIIIQNKPDIIQGWMYHGNLAALLGSIMTKRNIKLSWAIRLSLEIFKSMKLSTRIAIRLGSYMSRIPDLIIYNSTRSLYQHRYSGFSEKKDFFIPNGFDTKAWKPDKKIRLSLRKSFGISKASTIIGYVGRGDDQKDIPTLFKAFEIVSKKYQNIILVTIGRNLKKYPTNNKNIIFLGQRSDVNKIMKSFDLLCLSSKAEGFPNVIGEAMSTGVPCVTTDAGDAKNIVGDTGWVSPPNDPISLAKCLDSALKNSPSKLRECGKIARKKIVKNFSINDVKNQYISLYNSILD